MWKQYDVSKNQIATDTEFDKQLQPPQSRQVTLTFTLSKPFAEVYQPKGGEVYNKTLSLAQELFAKNNVSAHEAPTIASVRTANVGDNDKVSAATNSNTEDQVTIDTLDDNSNGETSISL